MCLKEVLSAFSFETFLDSLMKESWFRRFYCSLTLHSSFCPGHFSGKVSIFWRESPFKMGGRYPIIRRFEVRICRWARTCGICLSGSGLPHLEITYSSFIYLNNRYGWWTNWTMLPKNQQRNKLNDEVESASRTTEEGI